MPLFDAWPGEKLLIRIADIAERAGVGLLRPMQLRREGRAQTDVEAERRRALAQADLEIEQLKSGQAGFGRNTGQIALTSVAMPTLPALPPPELKSAEATPLPASASSVQRLGSPLEYSERALFRTAAKELQRGVNLERITGRAEEEAREVPDAEVSDDPINIDWMTRWRENAQDVTDEQMQLLWARILTEEARKPGSHSLRTLEFLRTASRAEADLIGKVAPFVIGTYIYKDRKYLEERGVVFDDLLALETLGLIEGVQSDSLVVRIMPNAGGTAFLGASDLVLNATGHIREVKVPVFIAPALGEEVFRICRAKTDIECIRKFARHLVTAGATCRIQPIVRSSGISLQLGPPLEVLAPPTDVQATEDATARSPQAG